MRSGANTPKITSVIDLCRLEPRVRGVRRGVLSSGQKPSFMVDGAFSGPPAYAYACSVSPLPVTLA